MLWRLCRFCLKTVLWTTLVCFILVTGFVASIPYLATTHWGTSTLLATLKITTGVDAKAEAMHLSWTGSQQLEGFKAVSPELGAKLGFESLNISSPLWEVLFHTGQQLNVEAKRDEVVIQMPFATDLNLVGGYIDVQSPSLPTASARSINARINIPSVENRLQGGEAMASLTAITEQDGLQGDAFVKLSLAGFDSSGALRLKRDQEGLRLSEKSSLSLEAKLANLPVRTLDAMLSENGGGLLPLIVGDSATLSAKGKVRAREVALDIMASSPTIDAQIKGVQASDAFTLVEPGSLRMWLGKELFGALLDKLENPLPIKNVGDSVLEVSLDRISIPFTQGIPAFFNTAFQLSLGVQPTTIHFSDHAPVALETLSAELSSSNISRTIQLKTDLSCTQKGARAAASATGEILTSSWFTEEGTPNEIFSGKFDLSGTLPAIADTFLGTDGVLTDLVGSEIDAKGLIKFDPDYALIGHISMKSPNLTLSKLEIEAREGVRLTSPAKFSYTAPTPLLKRIGLEASEAIRLSSTIEAFSIPQGPMGVGVLKMDFNTSPFNLRQLPFIEGLGVNRLLVDVSTEGLYHPKIRVEALAKPHSPALIGNEITLNSSVKLNLENFSLEQLRLKLDTNLIGVRAEADLPSLKHMHVKPASITYRLIPEALEHFTKDIKLLEPALISMKTDALDLDLEKDLTQQLSLKGNASIDQLITTRNDVESGLLDVNIPVQINMADEKASLQIQGKTYAVERNRTGLIDLDLQLKHFDPTKVTVRAKGQLEKLPTSVLGPLAGIPQLETLIGKTVNADLGIDIDRARPADDTVSTQIKGDQFSMDADLSITSDAITLKNKRALIDWTITEARFRALQSQTLALKSSAHLRASIDSLRIPLAPEMLKQKRLKLKSAIELGPTVLIDKNTQKDIEIEGARIFAETDNLAEVVQVTLAGQGLWERIPFSLKGTALATDIYNSLGVLDEDNLSLDLDLSLQDLPASLVNLLIDLDKAPREVLNAAFGKAIQGNVSATINQMSGPIEANLVGDNIDTLMSARVTDGVVSLSEPMRATLQVTEDVSKALLENVSPMFSSVTASENPIELRIDPAGFRMPLLLAGIEDIQVSRAKLSLGKLRIEKSNKVFSDLLQLLKLTKFGRSKEMDVWFTPLYFSLNRGKLRFERMDALLDNQLPIATWGDADIARDRLNMIVAVSSWAMEEAFGLRGMPEDFFLQIPLKGKVSKPDFQTKKAATQIGAIIAGGVTGGGSGLFQILGGVLQVASGVESGPVPPQTTTPLPWADIIEERRKEKYANEEQTPETPSKKPTEEEVDNPIQTIFDLMRKRK